MVVHLNNGTYENISNTTFRQLAVVSGQWSVVSGRWSVVGGRWSVVGGRWSVVGGRWSVGSWQFSVRSKRYGQDGLCTAGVAGLSPTFQRREHPISCQLAVVGCQGEFEVR
jgi:hypothetical protein